MTTEDDKKGYLAAQKKRNYFIAGGLLLFVVLVYFVTMSRLSQNTKAEALRSAQSQAEAAASAVSGTR
ncbi:hypothetical protein [Asticcacaulis sp. AC402]|uniref:hypothetical protein n=1 Tax=Asticcacaulis sp. AC402 TaxID=1282361 RepID=UPI0003C3C452|nr:hypothetical protein [Asticcacaulis sp. AC402]ESQ74477.1 hypothetical protein ABAC402_14255 [Asticcacaulis sp. AC402]